MQFSHRQRYEVPDVKTSMSQVSSVILSRKMQFSNWQAGQQMVRYLALYYREKCSFRTGRQASTLLGAWLVLLL